jgi:hypothetical protein
MKHGDPGPGGFAEKTWKPAPGNDFGEALVRVPFRGPPETGRSNRLAHSARWEKRVRRIIMVTSRHVVDAVALLLAAALPTFAQTAPQTFATPEAAAHALLSASTERDLIRILGPQAMAAISSSDAVADQITIEGFRAAAKESVVLRPQGPDRIIVVVGNAQIPVRVPLVKKGEVWTFDVDAMKKK